jgi:hypothetical protein
MLFLPYRACKPVDILELYDKGMLFCLVTWFIISQNNIYFMTYFA